jgi:hypothetical protein
MLLAVREQPGVSAIDAVDDSSMQLITPGRTPSAGSPRPPFPKPAVSGSKNFQSLACAIEDKAEAAYRRCDLFEKRRKLMDAWATFCAVPRAGKVVAFRR